jgi:hypothetical protein
MAAPRLSGAKRGKPYLVAMTPAQLAQQLQQVHLVVQQTMPTLAQILDRLKAKPTS